VGETPEFWSDEELAVVVHPESQLRSETPFAFVISVESGSFR
jgi:hypothetical protein